VIKHVVIIGNGISGVTAARFIRKLSDHRITIISDETDYFFARTALMYVYMGHLRFEDTMPYEDWFWGKNRIETVRDRVEEIDVGMSRLRLRNGRTVQYDILIIATGSRPQFFDWPGQNLAGVQGLYGVADLESMEAHTAGVQRAVVVGGGLIGIEMAEMLHSRHIEVSFLVREAAYMDYQMPSEEASLIGDEIRRHGIDLRLSTEVRELRGDSQGRVSAALTKSGDEIPCRFVGLCTGVRPNIEIVERSDIETSHGVLVNRYFETNVPNVYAIGDCAEFREKGIGNRRIEQLWYTGRKHGRTVAHTICGRRTPYDAGPYFNSAKFFTIEWQTYGRIRARRAEGVETLLWRDPRRPRLVRIDFDQDRVLGFNLLGVRFRHEVCDRWLREGRGVDYVLDHLREAHFDEELSGTRLHRHLFQSRAL